jgi:hypothetical protein
MVGAEHRLVAVAVGAPGGHAEVAGWQPAATLPNPETP